MTYSAAHNLLPLVLLVWGMLQAPGYYRAQDSMIRAIGEVPRRGEVYFTWGYNRAYYNKSDIHFKGDGYDFTLHNARADDMPEKFDPAVYFDPGQLTVPQFNFRIGYYFRDNTAISLGWDHMKYRLTTNQLVEIDGYIDEEKYISEEYTGQFAHDYILYSPRFMDFHHSDGFNFIRLALEKRVPFYTTKNRLFTAAFNGAVSLGAMMPWTDFTFFGVRHRNKPHFAGYGASVHAGFRFELKRYFFVQVHAQCGWSNLPDIMLEDELPSRASQKISFLERSWALGCYIPFNKKRFVSVTID
jgi:hypothetical protein